VESWNVRFGYRDSRPAEFALRKAGFKADKNWTFLPIREKRFTLLRAPNGKRNSFGLRSGKLTQRALLAQLPWKINIAVFALGYQIATSKVIGDRLTSEKLEREENDDL
jgi:hypothetical protein